MKIPIAVLISDIHYNLNTLEVADKALNLAVTKANNLVIPLVVAGDLHDTKALLRGECVKAMLDTFSLCIKKPYVLAGNHDRINEKSTEHSLEFLRKTAYLVEKPAQLTFPNNNKYLWLNLIPYYHDPEELKAYIKTLPPKSKIIMHQGVTGSNSGEYIQDKSAITKEDLAGHRVISGHYHNRQTIDLPEGSKFDYIGNPYTLNFAEANDPEKGFQILYSDGSLEFVPTNLRRHRVLEIDWQNIQPFDIKATDILWLKVKNAEGVTKKEVANKFSISQDFKLDLILPDLDIDKAEPVQHLTPDVALDKLIESSSIPADRKNRLKELWRDFTHKG